MLMRFFILFFALVVQVDLSATIGNLFVDEIESVDRAIAVSEKRLAAQHKVKNSLLELRHLEDILVKAENPKEAAARMVGLAEKILTMLQEEHLESLFSPAYIQELRFYSSFVRKIQVPNQSNP
jgi:hypothetical protein